MKRTRSPSPSPSPRRAFNINRQRRHEVHISMETLKSEEENHLFDTKNVGPPLNQREYDHLHSILQQDNNWNSLVLKVIGLMCDGQNRVLQDYLRDQPDNFKTVNVVAEVANFLHTYTTDLIGSDLSQINEILQTLIEMCVGNPKNQQVIFDTVIVQPLNTLLELTTTEKIHCDDSCETCQDLLLSHIQVKGSVVELLEIMLEETTPETSTIAEGIGYTINVNAIKETMEMFHKFQTHARVVQAEKDDDCERGLFRAYNVLTCLHNYKAISAALSEQIEGWKVKTELFTKCFNKTLDIEIHYESENLDDPPVLATVHFPYNDEDKLRTEVKEIVRWSINRDSMDDKHRALLELMPSLKADIKHQGYLKRSKYWKPLVAFHTKRHWLLLLLTIVLNLFLFVYRAPSHLSASSNVRLFLPDTPSWFLFFLYTLGSVHLILSLWMAIEYFVVNKPHFRVPLFFNKIQNKVVKLVNRGRMKKIQFVPRKSNCLDVNVFGVMTVYVIVFVTCSILSLATRGYFYPICLLYIIVNNDILQRVLRAVTKNGDALILVGILGIVVLFIYSVFSFAFLHNFFVPTSNGQLYCSTLGECMYSILRFGLLDNIGLLLPLNTTSNGNEEADRNFEVEFHYGRLIFDLSFFIIVITIGLNVVFGIIVDTFSQLREERSNVVQDEKSTCFICNLPSHEFDRKGGFKQHIKKEHNMWHYVYYSLHLEQIDTGDHNAIQKYVHEKITDSEESADFFPQEEAKCLASSGDSADSVMSDLMSKVDLILNHFNQKALQKRETAKLKDQEQWDFETMRRQR